MHFLGLGNVFFLIFSSFYWFSFNYSKYCINNVYYFFCGWLTPKCFNLSSKDQKFKQLEKFLILSVDDWYLSALTCPQKTRNSNNSKSSLYSNRMYPESTWNPPGIHLKCTWNPHGIHLECAWNPPGIGGGV